MKVYGHMAQWNRLIKEKRKCLTFQLNSDFHTQVLISSQWLLEQF